MKKKTVKEIHQIEGNVCVHQDYDDIYLKTECGRYYDPLFSGADKVCRICERKVIVI